MPLFLANIFGWIYAHWRLVGFILVIVVIVTYFSCRNSGLENELEREKEARSQEGQQRIDEAKTEDNRAAENINAAKNANYANLSNDELRNRLINAARKK